MRHLRVVSNPRKVAGSAWVNLSRSQPHSGLVPSRRCLSAVICALGIALCGLSFSARTAEFTVAAGDVAGLAAAIIESNANVDCSNRITLLSGTWTLTQVWSGIDAVSDTGLPLVDFSRKFSTCGFGVALEIMGAGADLTVIERAPSAPRLRHFSVSPGGFGAAAGFVLTDLTLRGGDLFSTDPSDFCCNAGAILVDSSYLTLNRVALVNNRAVQGGAIEVRTGGLFINQSRIEENSSARQGGAIYGSGVLRAEGSRLSDNTAGALLVPDASEQGGGALLWRSDGLSEIIESSIVSNHILFNTRSGGGIDVSGRLEIMRSELRGNESTGDGGGLQVEPGEFVGLQDSTLSGNFAPGRGSAIDALSQVGLNQVTIASNEALAGGSAIHAAVELDLHSSLIAATHMRGTLAAAPNCSNDSAVSSFGYNLDSDGSCKLAGVGDVSVFNPSGVLDLIARDNGGPTFTHALVRGGLAVDHGDPSNCSGTDQRGVQRPQDGSGDGIALCDIGAYELLPLADTDGDGIPDTVDQCPRSILTPTVVVGTCDSGVANALAANGCTISDSLNQCATAARNHGAFVSCSARYLDSLVPTILSGGQKGRIQSCVARFK